LTTNSTKFNKISIIRLKLSLQQILMDFLQADTEGIVDHDA
jgi:hypothetical protein